MLSCSKSTQTSPLLKYRTLLVPFGNGDIGLIVFDGYDHVPLLVVAEYPSAGLLEELKRLGSGVAVPVVFSDLDNGYLRRKVAEEERGGGGVRAVVGDLENAQRTGVRTVAHVLLGLLLCITSEEDAGRAEGQEFTDRVVVGLGKELVWRRGDHVRPRAAPIHSLSGAHLPHLRTFVPYRTQKGVEGEGPLDIVGQVDGGDFEGIEYVRKASYMVGV